MSDRNVPDHPSTDRPRRLVSSPITRRRILQLGGLSAATVALTSRAQAGAAAPAAAAPSSPEQHWSNGWIATANSAADFRQDSDFARSGSASLKAINLSGLAPNVYGTVWQAVAVAPQTTYVLQGWVKAESQRAAFLTLDPGWIQRFSPPDGTYDWREFSFEYTTGPNENQVNVRLVVQDLTGGLWLDDITLTVKNQNDNLLRNGGFESGPGDAALVARYDTLLGQLPALRDQLERASKRGIAVDYELVKYQTIDTFLRYGREELEHMGWSWSIDGPSRSGYIIGVLEGLHGEATHSVDSYLTGAAKSLVVPRYATGSHGVQVRGRSLVADTVAADGHTSKAAPVLLTGYGHFDQVERDIAKFKDFGVNAIQIEIGPDSTVFPADLPGYQPSGDLLFARDTRVRRTGKASLKVVSPPGATHTGMLTQIVMGQQNRTYQVSAWVRAQDASGLQIMVASPLNSGSTIARPTPPSIAVLPEGSYDWRQITFSATTGSEFHRIAVSIGGESVTGAVWIDELSVTEQGKGPNLVANPGFEHYATGDFSVDTTLVRDRVVAALQQAEKHDIAINLLLSPHLMPEFPFDKWPDLRVPNPNFLGYDINNPHARAIIQAHIEAVVSNVGHFASLQSLVLSNEPVYANSTTSQYTQSLWRAYLQRRYGTVDSMNVVWNTRYASFDVVQPLSGSVAASPRYYDWWQFNSTMFADWHQWMAEQVHRLAPGVPVQTKIMASMFGSRDALSWGVDPELFGALSEISGNDAFALLEAGRQGRANETGFYDLQSSMAEHPIFNTEDHLVSDFNPSFVPEHALNARQVLWNGAVHGRNGSTAWLWSVEWDMMLIRPDVVAAVGRAGLDLNRLADEITAFQNAKPRVAVLASDAANIYSADGAYATAFSNAHQALNYNGQKVRLITDRHVGEGGLSGTELLVLPNATHVESSTLKGVADYVRRGGHVVAIGDDNLSFDAYDRPLDATGRAQALNGALVLPATVQFEDLRTTLLGELKTLGIATVVLVDAGTGQPVDGVDYQTVTTNGQTIVNVVNEDAQAKQIAVQVNGQQVIASVHELIADATVGGSQPIPLAGLGVLLLALPPRTNAK